MTAITGCGSISAYDFLCRSATATQSFIIREFTMNHYRITAIILIGCIIVAAVPALAVAKTPITLSVEAPGDLGSRGSMLTKDWEIVFRLEAHHAVAVVKDLYTGQQALVLDDPDGCLHLGDFLGVGQAPFDFDCDEIDELWISFRPDRANLPGVELDSPESLCPTLVDDPASTPSHESNKAYLPAYDFPFGQTFISRIGPDTGGTSSLDCYGYGAHDHLPGLVVMADVGGARVFDSHFDRPDSLPDGVPIRNMAGFLSHVDFGFLSKASVTTLRGTIRVDNSFEPITLVDESVADPDIGIMTRHESGPVVTYGASEPEDLTFPLDISRFNEVTVRAVLVEGRGPDFISDMDGDGEYTARDLELAGFNLLSNQVQFEVVTEVTSVANARFDTACTTFGPFVYLADLDGNGDAGDFYECMDWLPGGPRAGTRIRR